MDSRMTIERNRDNRFGQQLNEFKINGETTCTNQNTESYETVLFPLILHINISIIPEILHIKLQNFRFLSHQDSKLLTQKKKCEKLHKNRSIEMDKISKVSRIRDTNLDLSIEVVQTIFEYVNIDDSCEF